MNEFGQRTIYYLPGFGGRLSTGLGQGLMDRGFDVTGRATRGDFRELPFEEQVKIVRQDLLDHFWHEHSQVVCNSFGSYLFLHAQIGLPPYVGRVLLLSPIVGEFTDEQKGTVFMPPRAHLLQSLACSGQFPTPAHAVIHVGANDWQSVPANVERFGALTGIPVTVAPGRGHMLGADYVGPLLDRFLAN